MVRISNAEITIPLSPVSWDLFVPDLDDSEIEPAAFRQVLGHFASGVTVITAAGGEGPVGFTCQSFTSLSLDPPLVCFAPARRSSSWPRIRAARYFCINVLAEDQAEISNAFARSGTDKFSNVAWIPGRHGAPEIANASARIHCQIHNEIDGGDHTVVIARVLDLAADSSRAPLVFYRGRYGLERARHATS